jgi:hypothetical protein
MGRDEAPGIRRSGRLTAASAASAKLVAFAAQVGADPRESGDAALQRLVMVLMAVGVLPLTILWSVVYFVAGAPLAGAAPAAYSVATPINTALFAWTRNLRLYRFIQLLMTLVLPWLVTMSLGGFRNSSAVIIWAALCPLVSLLVDDLRQTVLWIVGFVLLLIVSAVLEPSLKSPALPEAFVTWFFVLNLGAVIAVVFALLYYFVAQRNFFQERSEMLLLNILPKEISDALKGTRAPSLRTTTPQACSSRMLSDSPQWPRRWRRSAWSISSTRFSPSSTTWSKSTASKRSRRSATAIWSPPGRLASGPTTRWP